MINGSDPKAGGPIRRGAGRGQQGNRKFPHGASALLAAAKGPAANAFPGSATVPVESKPSESKALGVDHGAERGLQRSRLGARDLVLQRDMKPRLAFILQGEQAMEMRRDHCADGLAHLGTRRPTPL